MTEEEQEKLGEIIRAISRKDIANFAKYVNGRMVFKPFHVVYYTLLQMFALGQIKRLIIQMPPQCGKSQGSSRILPAFMLGLDPSLRMCICSYSATIARDFNRDVKRIIGSAEYRSLFPYVQLGGVNDSEQNNSDVTEIVGTGGSLRVVGRGGSLTSKTVDVAILDDLYKDYSEANSPIIRESAWKWYTTVLKTRLHNDSRELIVFTRWHEDDIIGMLEKSESVVTLNSWEDIGRAPKDAWIKINFEAIKESEKTELDPRGRGEVLWAEMHSREALEAQRKLDPVQFQCLHQGNPSSAEGRLYNEFKVWTDKSEWGLFIRSGCYVDVADEGSDYLCAISYDIYKSSSVVFNESTKRFEPLLFALVTDIEFTNESTDVTTITVPNLINRNNVQRAWIESNNGGTQFAKTVMKKVRAAIVPFFQGLNKESRIVTNSAYVNSSIIMPFGWEKRYKAFYENITLFLRDFRANKHDDAVDCLTGVYEKEIADGSDKEYGSARRGVTWRR